MSIVRDFHLILGKQKSEVSIVSEVKEGGEGSQIFHFNSSKVKQRSEHSRRFPFKSSEVK